MEVEGRGRVERGRGKKEGRGVERGRGSGGEEEGGEGRPREEEGGEGKGRGGERGEGESERGKKRGNQGLESTPKYSSQQHISFSQRNTSQCCSTTEETLES